MITRIEAVYPATDGSAPERIEITWEDGTPTPAELAMLVDALGRVGVPRRYEVELQPPDPAVLRNAIRDDARRLWGVDPRRDLATGGNPLRGTPMAEWAPEGEE